MQSQTTVHTLARYAVGVVAFALICYGLYTLDEPIATIIVGFLLLLVGIAMNEQGKPPGSP